MDKGITSMGIDAHKKTLQIALFDGRTVGTETRAPGGLRLMCCYEAGPCEYALKTER